MNVSRRLLAAIVLSIAGCSPDLQGSGFYQCTDRRCPDELPHCWSEEPGDPPHCHDRPEPPRDGGMDAQMPMTDAQVPDAQTPVDAFVPPDAPPPRFDYRACDDARPCMGGDLCVRNGPGTSGYCAPPCTAGRCPSSMSGMPGYCGGSHCRVGCGTDGDCPTGVECLAGRWGGVTANACVETGLATGADQYTRCATNADCDAPFACINQVCTRPCSGSATCLDGEACQNLPPPMMSTTTCLQVCNPGTCPADTTCNEAGMGTGLYRCIPMGWPRP
ncbi:hypothetical protein [Sandaracinus amylolyticus]|uniref:Uncharacterized protein n=1 Tax=Sandaracinus amylolyticus TaxID=927083 RepID=A0A0F6YM63_9BACT|nr:hypothetical protein [Sandaracinus amylolyticus]AKF09932.1 hypothetical protein DB32_007081 [Sandaracinus amylolyticus]